MIKLRPYQIEAIESIKRDWIQYTDVLLTMATGGGKTATFLSLLHDCLSVPGKRALIIAHRKELIEQPKARMIDYYPDWEGKIGIVMADQNENDKPITIATIQTLQSDKRLQGIISNGAIDYLITDECHHLLATNTYGSVLETLKAFNPDLRHLGVTATPIRSDGDGLSGVYQKESAHYGIIEMIKTGYLVPIRWLAIQVGISIAEVKTQAGDYQSKGLKNVFETSNCLDLVVESHKKYASDRQAIAFTVSVEGAHSLAAKFNEAGILASSADGTTDKAVRQKILDDFRAGKTQVLCNCALFTEGMDIPEVSCVHQVRPTKSDSLYTQMIGRALRLFPGKDDALILDYAPVEARNIAMLGDVLGVPLRKESYIKDEDEEGEVIAGMTFDGSVKWMTGNPADIISRQLDYLELTPFHWFRHDGWMSLGLGKASDEIDRTLVLSPPKDGIMTLYLVAKRPDKDWKAWVMQEGDFDQLSKYSDDYSGKRGQPVLMMKQRKWHKEMPSEAQVNFAKRLKGCWQANISMTKGLLAQRITHFVAMQAIRKLNQEVA